MQKAAEVVAVNKAVVKAQTARLGLRLNDMNITRVDKPAASPLEQKASWELQFEQYRNMAQGSH